MKKPTLYFVLLLVIWGGAAVAAGAFHLLAFLPPASVPILVALPTIALSIASRRSHAAQSVLADLGVRGLIAAHVGRFVGIYFLWLHAQGRLPAEFAYRAGWGDVASASGAAALLMLNDGPFFRRALLGWNVFGLLDLIVAVGTGAWLNLTRPGSMIELASFPATMVPLFLVPLMIASHLVMLRRAPGASVSNEVAA